MDELALCNICTEEFDDDPSIRPSDGMSSHLPIQSARCSHTSSICYSCIMKIKMNKAVEENKDPCKIKWLGCPDCRKMTCFNTEDLIVDIGRCKMLRLLRNKSDSSSNNTSTGAPPVGGGESAASVDILQTSNANQLLWQNNDSTETRGISSSITTRSASRQKRGTSNQLTHIQDEESRFSTLDGTPARKRTRRTDKKITSTSEMQLSVTMSGRKSSEDTNDLDEEDIHDRKMSSEEDASDFNQILSKANSLYRIRQFTKASITPEDKFGRGVSDWAISKGYCASSDRVLTGEEPDNAMRYLRKTDLASIKDSCRGYELFDMSERNLTTYCGSYKRFACMEKDDMVAMNIPGPVGKGEAYFGVITSNKLILKDPDECLSEGFPAMHLLGGDYPFNGLMLREVKWMRKGYIRDLPGQKVGLNGAKSLPWLIESAPFWLLKSSSGLEIMKGKAFLDSTRTL